MAEAVDWWAYFKRIRTQCPWSYVAYNKGLIDIVTYSEPIHSLDKFSARMYVVDLDNSALEALCEQLDSADAECEWLFSYPGYGDWATPVSVLIQQNRQQLTQLRQQLNPDQDATGTCC